ncbi:MAG: phytanoyl-CoA dioxygenase family protein [Gemmatimonadota bacterium]|nr:phytanoyl-CoA dioxygenase family protein [Gemmatimonadota bacterium]
MAARSAQDKYDQLLRDGFCVVEGVLKPEMLERVRTVSDRLLDAQSPSHFEEQKSTGSMVSVFDDVFFAELVSYPPALAALADLGFDRPTWSSGYVISKPPRSPALFWHQDWWGWDDPCSYEPPPQQVFLMYYLVDTDRHNGCLRVIAGSHLNRHPLHQYVEEAHTGDLRAMADPDHPAYQPAANEVDVPVRAGDLVIGDSRLLHAAHGNKSDQRRTVITLWYIPLYHQLPGRIQACLARHPRPDTWTDATRGALKPLTAVYEGEAEPIAWNRVPGQALK